MPNLFKSGTTATNGCIYKGNFIIGVDPAYDYGPTSATSFYNGVSPAVSGYTIYQTKAANGPSIKTAADDATMVSILQSMGSTGATASGALNWVQQQPNIMVANIDYYGIVTSGLTFAVDASYVSSYPISGKTWYDLTKNGNNLAIGNQTNPPTYSSTSGGTLVTSSVSNAQITATTTNISATTYTYCAFVNISSGANPNSAIMMSNPSPGAGPGIYLQSTPGSGIFFNSTAISPLSAYTNAWKYIVGVQDATTQYVYVNGSLITSSASTLTTGSTSVLQVAYNAAKYLTGSGFGSLQIYNRALSATEVTQNYNVLKTRFGL